MFMIEKIYQKVHFIILTPVMKEKIIIFNCAKRLNSVNKSLISDLKHAESNVKVLKQPYFIDIL